MRGGIVWACVCGAVLSALGCGSRQIQTISLGNADSGRTVVASIGDQVEVTLQTIGPGQYGDPTVSSHAALFLGESPVNPPIPAGATQLFRFEAIAPGRADVTIPHTGDSPEGPTVPAFSFSLQVN